MKGIRIYESIHTDLKVECARANRTVPNGASLLLKHAIGMVRDGKLDLGALEAAEKKASRKVKA